MSRPTPPFNGPPNQGPGPYQGPPQMPQPGNWAGPSRPTQPPGQRPPGQQPFAQQPPTSQPDPRWRAPAAGSKPFGAQPFGSQVGSEQQNGPAPGTVPLGRTAEPSVTIEQYRHKRSMTMPVIIMLVVIMAVAGIIYFGQRASQLGEAENAASSPARTSTRTPAIVTPGQAATSLPFEIIGGHGVLTVNESEWESTTLIANITLELDEGTLEYDFSAMDATTGDVYTVVSNGELGDLVPGRINAGESLTGTIRFVKPRGPTQLLLTDELGFGVAMLLLPG